MATVEGSAHIVRYVNPAFCGLVDEAKERLIGRTLREIWPDKVELLALMDHAYRTGESEGYTEQKRADPHHPVSWSYSLWPVKADQGVAGVMIQMTETAPLYEKTRAMNEALVLGSLRQHELAEVANSSNAQLQTEVGEGKQRALDAQMLTNEISHRIKNNLQLIVALISREVMQAAAQCVPGYEAMLARIEAIADLYDLISQSSDGQTVRVDAYLMEIARTMSASSLGKTSGVKIEVDAEAFDIDPDRAVPLGLLVNELTTNAIKHAFPDGTGRVTLRARRIGDQITIDVVDNGVGMTDKETAQKSGKHGGAYVTVFVRQLRGALAVLESEEPGTTVRVRFPWLESP